MRWKEGRGNTNLATLAVPAAAQRSDRSPLSTILFHAVHRAHTLFNSSTLHPSFSCCPQPRGDCTPFGGHGLV
jgi:hypothetical protein